MKKLIFLLLIVLVINDTDVILQAGNPGITKEEAKNKIISALRSAGSKVKYNYPSNYQKYVTDLTSTTIVKFDQILHTKIDSLKWSHNFPDKTINKFKAIKYSKNTISYETFEFSYNKARTKIGNVFGVATKLDDNYVYFAYVKGEANAKAIIQFNSIPYRHCSRFLFFKSCETRHRREKRGFNYNELQIIENALKAKFYETLNSILDLDQQKMIEKFKTLASMKRTSYPSFYKKYVVTVKTYLDFKTTSLYSTNDVQSLKNKDFNEKTRNLIKNIFGKPNNSVNIYLITKDETDELRLKMGVAYSVGGRILLSYVDAISESKRYEKYCNMKEDPSKETCLDDSVCVEECKAYEKLVKDPKHPEKDIQGFNKKQYKNNLKKILLADVTNEVYDILKEIKF